MSFSKDSLLRYFLVDFKLHQSPPPTTEDLRIHLEQSFYDLTGKSIPISKLTVKNDIKNMRKVFLCSIKFSFDTNRYYYQFPETQSFLKFPKGINDLILNFLRLHYLFGSKYPDQLYVYTEDKTIPGSEHLEHFARAVLEKKKIKFTYKSYNAKRTRDYIVHPYLIREHRGAYLIIGKKDADGEMKNFVMHRLEGKPEILQEPAEIDEAYDRQVMLESPSSLLSLGNRLLEITIEGRIEILPELLSTPLHPSQTVVSSNDEKFRISMSALATEEMIATLLKYGDQLEVISPEKFRSFFADRIFMLFKKYTGLRA